MDFPLAESIVARLHELISNSDTGYAGGVVVTVPLLLESSCGHALDLEGLEVAFASGARALILCNPHNPLGLAHSRETLRQVATLAARFGVTVVSDEIHGPLTHPGVEFVPFL
jgi:cystathionine beta-lyase